MAGLVPYSRMLSIIRFLNSNAKAGVYFEYVKEMLNAYGAARDIDFGKSEADEIREKALRYETANSKIGELYRSYIYSAKKSKPNSVFSSSELFRLREKYRLLAKSLDKNEKFKENIPLLYIVDSGNGELRKSLRYPKNVAAISLFNTLLVNSSKSGDEVEIVVFFIPYLSGVEIYDVVFNIEMEYFDTEEAKDKEVARKAKANERAKERARAKKKPKKP